jgi:hypothetical protein
MAGAQTHLQYKKKPSSAGVEFFLKEVSSGNPHWMKLIWLGIIGNTGTRKQKVK